MPYIILLLLLYYPENFYIHFISVASRPVLAWQHCRISPPRFLAMCHRRQLNQASSVLLYFALFGWYLVWCSFLYRFVSISQVIGGEV